MKQSINIRPKLTDTDPYLRMSANMPIFLNALKKPTRFSVMWASLTLSLLMSALSACTQTAGEALEPINNTITSTVYQCSDGINIAIVSTPTETSLNLIELRRLGQIETMQRVQSASGVKYSSAKNTWRMHGQQAMYIVEDQTPIQCQHKALPSKSIERVPDQSKII